jgi:hypothetical protein
MSEESPDARQKGAMDSAKKKIHRLEKFLEAKCPARVKDIVALWQYETGQAPRKTKEYMESIRAAGKIEFFDNDREDWVRFIPPESFTDYARRRQHEKVQEINEVRRKLGLRPIES